MQELCSHSLNGICSVQLEKGEETLGGRADY